MRKICVLVVSAMVFFACVSVNQVSYGQECVVFTGATRSCGTYYANFDVRDCPGTCDIFDGCDPSTYEVHGRDWAVSWDGYRDAVGNESGYNFEDNSGRVIQCWRSGDCVCVFFLMIQH